MILNKYSVRYHLCLNTDTHTDTCLNTNPHITYIGPFNLHCAQKSQPLIKQQHLQHFYILHIVQYIC